jgi:site-specific DNA recombinase
MAKANSNGHALIPAVPYYRMSDDRQEASIPAQRKAVEKYAAEHGYKIIREYQDDGIAGWKDTREGFQRLISDLARGDFKAVLVWDQNRFSRFPPMEANYYWFQLDRAGVHLASCNQGKIDWHSIAGWLTASINQFADSQHRHKLSADVKRGMREQAERGEWGGGAAPLGYVLGTDRKLAIGDPAKVALVQRIFRECSEGYSVRGIAHRLNAEGIKTSAGKDWTATAIQRILKQPAYDGTFSFNDGEIQIAGNHPAIITPDVMTLTHEKLSQRRRLTTPIRNGGEYVLTGMLRCGKCGSAMFGKTYGKVKQYACSGRTQKGATFCDLNTCQQTELLDRIVKAIERHFKPSVIQRLRAELYRQIKKDCRNVSPKTTKQELANVETKLEKAKRRLVEVATDMIPVVQEQIRALRQDIERLQALLKASETPQDERLADVEEKIDQAMKRFANLRQTLEKANPVKARELFRDVIDRVDVWSELVEGNRTSYSLDRGVVHLRNNLLHGASVGQLPSPPFFSPAVGWCAR